MQEKQFIEKGARKVRLDEFLADELEGAGYSKADIVRTPTSTKIVIYAQRPGLVIGRGGSRINELTEDVEEEFGFENPQIEVNEIDEPDAEAQVVADSIADWLEKGGHAKRVGYTYLRRMKEAGVIGAEIEITGKLSGNRGRTEKFSYGYVKRCGNTSKDNVRKGYALARTKPGAIGVKVRIMEEMPEFMHRDVDVSEEILHQSSEEEEDFDRTQTIQEVIEEAENMTSAELERAIEEKASEIGSAEISKDEVRDAFEEMDEEPAQGVEEELEEAEEKIEEAEEEIDDEEVEEELEEAEEAVEEAEEDFESSHEDIVQGTISEAKEKVGEIEDPDFGALLQAEKAGKNRKTFIEWLERQKE
ncbi:MAG: 30S ribosomal protein S3 [Candidatus Nanohalobium sp.]